MKKQLLSIIFVILLGFSSMAQVWLTQGAGFTTASRGIMNIYPVNSQVVWAAAYDGTGGTNGCQDFTKTINGGTTWTPGIVNATVGLQSSQITAADATTAWVCMYKATGSAAQGVYKTTDGGATWTHQATALFTNSASFPDAIHFWDANTGWVLGDPISGKFEMYTTTDGGTTWTAVSGTNPAALSGEYGYTSNCAVAGNSIFFGTNKGRIFASTDKGHNWTVVTPPNFTGKNSFPAFKDAMNGLALKYQTSADTLLLLDKSTDGGVTFTAATYSGPVFTGEIQYVPGTANTYVTTGVDATNQPGRLGMTYSFDGGATWHYETNILGNQATTSAWLNDSTGWVGAFNGDATDGLYKFNSVLSQPIANFATNDTALMLGGTAHYTNLSSGKPTTFAWTFQGGTPASSALQTPPAITYNTPGDYNVTLVATSDFGSSTKVKTGYIHVGGVGINEHSSAVVSIFPNPVMDIMNIQGNSSIKQVQIFNLVGQLVFSQELNSKTVTVNTSAIQTGVYNVKISMDNGTVNKKIVVK